MATQSVKFPDNLASKYMSADDLKLHGRQCGTSHMHIGLPELVEWMQDMEAKEWMQE